MVAQPIRIVDALAGADAQQDVVWLEIGVLEVVDVVRHDERQPEIPGNRLEADVDDALLVDALILHLQEEVPRTENVPIRGGGIDRLLLLFRPDSGRDLSLQTAAQSDEAGRVLREQFLVDPGLVVEPLGVTGGDELDQVVIPLVGRREEDQVVRRLAGCSALRPPIARSNVHLTAENRIDSPLPRLIVKDDRREHVAVLGNRERRHLELHRAVEELLDAARAVEQRVLGVQVQMDEISHCNLRRIASSFQLPASSSSFQSNSEEKSGYRPKTADCRLCYSHSMVDGGFELMSNTTRLMPLTSFTIRDEIDARRSCGRRAQSAVIPSLLSTALIAIVYS